MKFGDTLIEVTLAIAIFSLIAISVTAVVSRSTSSAQVALEQTLTREEIDAQAEALRFIQSSYVNAKVFSEDKEDNDYTDIWHEIITHAKVKNQITEDLLKFQPSTCAELYEGNTLTNQGAFVINTRKMASLDPNQVVLFARDNKVFYPSQTYPHLVYGMSANTDPLVEGNLDDNNIVSRAEGIYIIAVKDPDTTIIVDGEDNTASISKTAAFFDFYIRSCWYAPGAETPTTVSTVIRLYDPDAIEVVWPEDPDGGGSDPGEIIDDDPEDPLAVCSAATRPTTLQTYNRSYCSRCASQEVGRVELTDERDERTYNVRYINGNCWMVSDLAITGDIDADKSNFNGTTIHIPNSWTDNSMSEPRTYTQNGKVYYNFAAASAGSIVGDRAMSYETPSDICPSGWKLPSATQKLTVFSFAGLFEPSYGGYYDAGSIQQYGEGYWWGSSRDSGSNRTAIFYRNGELADGGGNRAYGYRIRCIMK